MISRKISLETAGIHLAGQFYLPDAAEGQTYPTVCICHGIPAHAPDPSDRGYALLAEKICREGLAVLIFNFRGCGESGGNIDIEGWTGDLEAMVGYLGDLPEVNREKIYLLGFSGGAAVSVYVAAGNSKVSAVAACACPSEFDFFGGVQADELIKHFRSIGAIRDENFPRDAEIWFNGFEVVKPIDYVAEIAPRPVLLVHGSEDATVAAAHAYRLYEKARQPKELAIIEGAEHRLRVNDKAMAVIVDWLKLRAVDL